MYDLRKGVFCSIIHNFKYLIKQSLQIRNTFLIKKKPQNLFSIFKKNFHSDLLLRTFIINCYYNNNII